MKYVYIAGPYVGEHDHTMASYLGIDRNIARAREAMARLVKNGFGVFCPHTHSAHFEVITPSVTPRFWLNLDIHFLETGCDIFLRLPGYSKGADEEEEVAESMGLPIYYSVGALLYFELR